MEIFPKKLGNAPVAELLYVVLDFFASIKKRFQRRCNSPKEPFLIYGNDKTYLLEILELDAVCL